MEETEKGVKYETKKQGSTGRERDKEDCLNVQPVLLSKSLVHIRNMNL